MQANDWNRLFETLKKEAPGEASDAEVQSAVNGLTAQQKQKLGDILSSPEKMKAFLQTDAARTLMKKLGKKGS